MRLFQIERVNQIKFTTYRAKTILSEASDRFRTVSPICLPEPWTSFPPDTECLVSGWGKTKREYIPILLL